MATPRRKTTKSTPALVKENGEEPVLVEERSIITNFEEVRISERGMDTFKIYLKEHLSGDPVVVKGHEIGMASSESETAKLPIYQIIEYVPVSADARYTRAFNKGIVWDEKTQSISVENVEGDKQYIKVVKAILWPGEWSFVTRELGE